jgi:hypothetical protein
MYLYTTGNIIPVSGSLQPDERRMLENTIKIIQGTYEPEVTVKSNNKRNTTRVLSTIIH